LGFI
jgi:hypothetical protein